jgi:hypothetical protein
MRILIILLITLGLPGLTACSGGDSSSSPGSSNPSVEGIATASKISVVTTK